VFMMRVWLTVFIGHKYLYENGVLHRDISPGNILIKWWPGSEAGQPGTSGCLIDLDHAKRGKRSPEQVAAQQVEDKLHYLVDVWCSEERVEPEIAHQASVFFAPSGGHRAVIALLTYLEAASKHCLTFKPLNGGSCTLQRLGWQSVRGHCILLCGSDYRHC
jgi:serine/threonine protein kinase